MKTYSVLRKVIGDQELVMELDDGATLEDLAAFFTKSYREKFRKETGSDLERSLSRNFNIYVNGRLVHPANYPQTRLEDGDEVVFMQPIGGG